MGFVESEEENHECQSKHAWGIGLRRLGCERPGGKHCESCKPYPSDNGPYLCSGVCYRPGCPGPSSRPAIVPALSRNFDFGSRRTDLGCRGSAIAKSWRPFPIVGSELHPLRPGLRPTPPDPRMRPTPAKRKPGQSLPPSQRPPARRGTDDRTDRVRVCL